MDTIQSPLASYSSSDIRAYTWKVLELFSLGFALVVGLSFSNIVHFTIEDMFDVPVIGSMFFGDEFARSLSWLLLSGVFYIITSLAARHLHKKQGNIAFPWKKIIYIGALIVLFLISLSYVVGVIYGYFGAYTDVAGLYRAIVTVCMNLLGMAYIFFELRYQNTLKPLKFIILTSALVGLLSLIGLKLTLSYAPPSDLRMVRKDMKKRELLKTLPSHIKHYYEQQEEIPKKMEDLFQLGILSHTQLHTYQKEGIEYNPKEKNTFDVCATFQTNHQDGRRLKGFEDLEPYSRGAMCLSHTIKKQKGDVTVVVKNTFSNTFSVSK
jgi:hypothetical protein